MTPGNIRQSLSISLSHYTCLTETNARCRSHFFIALIVFLNGRRGVKRQRTVRSPERSLN